jgi:hypothetical protein
VARLSAAAVERGRRLFEKSDDELGRWLADLERRVIERVACEKAGIAEIYAGRNALAEPPESTLARRIVEFLIDENLDRALRFDDDAPQALAVWLALRGDHERAGRAMRKSMSATTLKAHARREYGLSRMRATKLGRQVERVTEWARIGVDIREKERGPRMSTLCLAREIARQTGDAVNSIRVELPKLKLDPASCPAPVKLRPRKKTNRKLRTFGSLRR